jgi:2-C-methyl-D-erythritol 4-phosphate cytidylyltransferase
VASALLVAAGKGERLGSSGPKAFVPLAGRPMLEWSIAALRAAGITDIVVALPEGFAAPAGTTGVPGGAERSHSVRAALAACSGDPVLVHDAARPLATPELIRASIDALAADPELAAAIVAAPVTDTIKRSADGGSHAAETLDRSTLWAVQTPQVFRREWLERALAASDDLLAVATDDASLVEALGGRVGLVRSGPENLKVTTPHDLRVAELYLQERTSAA